MFIEQSQKKSPLSEICKEYITVKLTCNDGFTVILCSVGASIRQILFPTSDGHLKNIALAFDDDTACFSNSLYAGATLAPCAGRISHGKLSINNTLYSLSLNENNTHTLHGGFHNASFKNWELISAEISDENATVIFKIILEDGLDGFPGNREIKAIYMLKEDHTLTLRYEAISDKDTYFNISNHTYFNLSGNFSDSVLTHKVQINADQYISNTPEFIPENVLTVNNTPFDLRKMISLQEQILTYPDDIQIRQNLGFNHEYILNHNTSGQNINLPVSEHSELSDKSKTPDLICTAPDNSLQLQVTSDAPCVVIYSGGYFETGIKLKDNQFTTPNCALAFEFQGYLDAPGNHGFPYHITKAKELWHREICYRFLK